MLPKYELTYLTFAGDAAVAHIECYGAMSDGPFTTFALEDGTPVLTLPNQRILEILNLAETHRVVPQGQEVPLRRGDGGKFAARG